MGMIYQRKQKRLDGTVRVLPTLWIKYYQNGRAVRESTGTTKETVARRMLRAREGDVEQGHPDHAEEWARHVRGGLARPDPRLSNQRKAQSRPHEAPAEAASCAVLRRQADGLDQYADIRAFIVARQAAGAANGEINRELSALKRMFNLAMQAGKLHARPHVPMLKEHNVRTGFFELEQFQIMREHLPSALQPVVTFAYLTGWRVPSEVLSLQWRQVDLQAGTVRLDAGTTKNDRGRLLPYGDVLPELKDLLDLQREVTQATERSRGVIVPWVFHRNGKPIRDFRGAWDAACKLAGCPGRIPHDFRRTAVRNLTRHGVPERVAMQITGHRTRSVFDRYDIVSEQDLREGLKKLAGTLPGTLTTKSVAARNSA